MKKLMTVLLALAFLIPAAAFAQSTMQDNHQAKQAQANQAAEESSNGSSTQPEHQMMGMVSNGGMAFTHGNTAYQVSNPDKLKNYDNQNVTVDYYYNTDKNSIKISRVNPDSK
jgi:hypothetical protein